MIKLLSVTIVILSITVILAMVVAYWLFIAYIEVSASEITVTATVPETLSVSGVPNELAQQDISVEPTTGVPALNQDVRLQWAR
jgi:hypothetical protein